MKISIALALALSTVIVACMSVQLFNVDDDVSRLIADGGVFLDVRTNSEYADGHLDGAINIPLGRLRTDYVQLDPNRTYVTYCSHGLRSIKAVEILKENGFKHVFNGGSMSKIEALRRSPEAKRDR
ncbi:rhodanese-like domain-containing protein [Rhodocyclus tenuis]|uniref:Rhodanese-like domain-containing protein n=2 Tax=Rhodocyclus gracilis TaxID=2929842 RepID=A0ABX0WKU5_9RHOO|nr:rhodanese-like domain-containing protein [Rhodocyclus gracilis]